MQRTPPDKVAYNVMDWIIALTKITARKYASPRAAALLDLPVAQADELLPGGWYRKDLPEWAGMQVMHFSMLRRRAMLEMKYGTSKVGGWVGVPMPFGKECCPPHDVLTPHHALFSVCSCCVVRAGVGQAGLKSMQGMIQRSFIDLTFPTLNPDLSFINPR